MSKASSNMALRDTSPVKQSNRSSEQASLYSPLQALAHEALVEALRAREACHLHSNDRPIRTLPTTSLDVLERSDEFLSLSPSPISPAKARKCQRGFRLPTGLPSPSLSSLSDNGKKRNGTTILVVETEEDRKGPLGVGLLCQVSILFTVATIWSTFVISWGIWRSYSASDRVWDVLEAQLALPINITEFHSCQSLYDPLSLEFGLCRLNSSKGIQFTSFDNPHEMVPSNTSNVGWPVAIRNHTESPAGSDDPQWIDKEIDDISKRVSGRSLSQIHRDVPLDQLISPLIPLGSLAEDWYAAVHRADYGMKALTAYLDVVDSFENDGASRTEMSSSLKFRLRRNVPFVDDDSTRSQMFRLRLIEASESIIRAFFDDSATHDIWNPPSPVMTAADIGGHPVSDHQPLFGKSYNQREWLKERLLWIWSYQQNHIDSLNGSGIPVPSNTVCRVTIPVTPGIQRYLLTTVECMIGMDSILSNLSRLSTHSSQFGPLFFHVSAFDDATSNGVSIDAILDYWSIAHLEEFTGLKWMGRGSSDDNDARQIVSLDELLARTLFHRCRRKEMSEAGRDVDDDVNRPTVMVEVEKDQAKGWPDCVSLIPTSSSDEDESDEQISFVLDEPNLSTSRQWYSRLFPIWLRLVDEWRRAPFGPSSTDRHRSSPPPFQFTVHPMADLI